MCLFDYLLSGIWVASIVFVFLVIYIDFFVCFSVTIYLAHGVATVRF